MDPPKPKMPRRAMYGGLLALSPALLILVPNLLYNLVLGFAGGPASGFSLAYLLVIILGAVLILRRKYKLGGAICLAAGPLFLVLDFLVRGTLLAADALSFILFFAIPSMIGGVLAISIKEEVPAHSPSDGSR